jgi:hypothetical protein
MELKLMVGLGDGQATSLRVISARWPRIVGKNLRYRRAFI